MFIRYKDEILNLKWAKHIYKCGDTKIQIVWGPDFRETNRSKTLEYTTVTERDRAFETISDYGSMIHVTKNSPQKTVYRLKGSVTYLNNIKYESALKASNALIALGMPSGISVVKEEIDIV